MSEAILSMTTEAGNRSAGEYDLSKKEITAWTWLASKGIATAFSCLSEMTGQTVRINSLDLKCLSENDAFLLADNAESPAVAVHVSIDGNTGMHLLLLYDPETAYRLIDTQLNLKPGSTIELGEMERLSLKEIGSLTGAYFLNTIADCADIILMPSPPALLTDSQKAVLEVPLSSLATMQQKTLALKARFNSDELPATGMLLILPTTGFISNLLEGAGKSGSLKEFVNADVEESVS